MPATPLPVLKYVPGIFIIFLLMASARSKEEPLSAMGLLEWDCLELVAKTNEPIIEITAREGEFLESGSMILQQAEASVAQAEARVRALSITLDNLALRAPRQGRLDNLPYELGERPATGAVTAVMLVNKTPYARVYVPETLRAKVHQGTQASIYVDGLDKTFTGHVRKISDEAMFTPYYSLTERDRSRLSYLAEVVLNDTATPQLPSGVPVRVEFQAAE